MRSEPSPTRSRSRGQRTATGPMPVMISRSGRCPWRTSRWRPSAVSLSAWQLSKAATSASTACASSAQAPLRKTSVSESAKLPGWESRKTLVSVTAYHSFSGEVEASSTPTIRRLTPSCRHQLSSIAQPAVTLRTLRQHESDHRREATRQRSGICEALAEDTQVLLRMAKAWLLSPSLHSYIGKTTDRKIHAEKVKTSASPGRKAGLGLGGKVRLGRVGLPPVANLILSQPGSPCARAFFLQAEQVKILAAALARQGWLRLAIAERNPSASR